MLTKELCTEIKRLGKTLTLQEIGDSLRMSKYKVFKLIKQYAIPYKKKHSTQPIRQQTRRKKFEAKVKRNYIRADVWIPDKDGRFILVMRKGKLENTDFARQWWKDKMDKVWGRRNEFSLRMMGTE